MPETASLQPSITMAPTANGSSLPVGNILNLQSISRDGIGLAGGGGGGASMGWGHLACVAALLQRRVPMTLAQWDKVQAALAEVEEDEVHRPPNAGRGNGITPPQCFAGHLQLL